MDVKLDMSSLIRVEKGAGIFLPRVYILRWHRLHHGTVGLVGLFVSMALILTDLRDKNKWIAEFFQGDKYVTKGSVNKRNQRVGV